MSPPFHQAANVCQEELAILCHFNGVLFRLFLFTANVMGVNNLLRKPFESAERTADDAFDSIPTDMQPGRGRFTGAVQGAMRP